MLYVFYGSDIAKSRDKAGALISFLRNKRPDASFIHVDADKWSTSIIEEHAAGQGLFSNKYIVFLDRITENRLAKEEIIDSLSLTQDSSNIFIVLEGKVLSELKKAFDKYAEKVVESEEIKNTKFNKNDFNIFALADAVGARDSFKSWSLYRQAIDKGIESENIIGTLFWQIKSLILAAQSKSAAEAGLNPFVFSKSKKYSSNYSPEELYSLMEKLNTLYHDGHRGLVNLELSVERLMLGLGK